ncbi:hypothetical protein HG536_0H00580 [Torulaspora globosa]|uniref:phosphopentomutase n=1 Tax=Torulaspora globosa TaxID=48254 RepID=A0A7G3ZME7_9SACH|nr:uncharacterized protein HG536_0H00580 [Torulaspora globosa]QLL34683.1 hypothetical protein HG536_0H00580 [Torulaspora globosa]
MAGNGTGKAAGGVPADLNGVFSLWLAQDSDEETRCEILELYRAGRWCELHERLDTRLAFGTAGLRARMGAGFNRMNALVVIQTTQGLAQYVKKQSPERLVAVVGHDHRYRSQRFAAATAATLVEAGFTVHLLNKDGKLVHTPMVPFAVNEMGASVGVMITASHNPATDNGYKVYYSNGCQIIPPHDSGIAQAIEENLGLWPRAWKWDEVLEEALRSGSLLHDGGILTCGYASKMEAFLVDKTFAGAGRNGRPWFVYTPMHGVGFEIFSKIVEKTMGLVVDEDYLCVRQQQQPDPAFPTVQFPNPEEKGALDLAISLAESNDIGLVLANDPDADRFSVAYKDPSTRVWRQLTGNEIGFLFAVYEYQRYQTLDAEFRKRRPLAMLNSTVSSQMMKKMAETEGFHYVETLTGFKWIGNRALDLEAMGYYVPFGFEEAIGYMFPSMEHDKDGIAAAVVFLQAYRRWLDSEKKTLSMIIEEGYQKYGVFKEYNGYYVVDEPAKTDEVFHYIRNEYPKGHDPYPYQVGNELTVTHFRDLTEGYQSDTVQNIPTLPVDASSQMITVCAKLAGTNVTETVRFTLRGSGTEPKLKVYIEACAKTEEQAQKNARMTWEILKREWFRPEITGLTTNF